MVKCAGILFLTPDGKILLLKRSKNCDHPREFDFPGGYIEEGKTSEQSARRECLEETGFTYTGELNPIFHTIDDNVDYQTFIAHTEEFTPKLDHEHTAYLWRELDDMPSNLHPGVKALLASDAVRLELGEEIKTETRADSAEVVTEMDIAKKIRDGLLTSPQIYRNITLFAVRISGTGVALRANLNEYVQRNPDDYLNDEFLERCNGLPVIWVHPENNKLDSQSFGERVVGTICLPYIKGNEVWGIAKIYDENAAHNMSAEQLSTSPAVTFQAGTNTTIPMSDGTHVLIEGKPNLLDHLAIVENGVWDKGGEPSGVLLENAHAETAEASRADSADPRGSSLKGEVNMAEPIVAPAEKSAEEQILALLTKISTDQEGIIARLEALEDEEEAEVGEIASGTADGAVATGSPTMMEPSPQEEHAIVADKARKDAEEKSRTEAAARLDSVEKELAGLKENAARADNTEEKEKLMEAQGRADAVEQCHADAAPRPLLGETVIDYEKRMVQKHLKYSPRWKNSNIKAINDPATFNAIRDEVYADSITAAKNCVGTAEGSMREVVRNGIGGRKVHEWFGSPSAWTNEFKSAEMTGRIMPASH